LGGASCPARLWTLGCLVLVTGWPVAARPAVLSQVTLRDPGIADQDDMCIWLHPSDLSRSTVVCSDKTAYKIFVYDLSGNTLQVIAAEHPGNIDVRYQFPLGGKLVDIVALNERGTSKIRVYKVDPSTRQLQQVDDGGIDTGPNYGFTLYRSPTTGKLYGFTGPKSTTVVHQWELVDNGAGQVAGVGPLRQFQPGGMVEGMVADDETGMMYVSEESGGIWKYPAEPDQGSTGAKIAPVGENGLTADVEGISLYYRAKGAGYILVSSQGNSSFNVYDRRPPHAYLGTFTVDGVTQTDGVDVINLPLDARFSLGLFVCHNGAAAPYPVELVKWGDIAAALGLPIETRYWDPRHPRIADVSPPSLWPVSFHVVPNPARVGARLSFHLTRETHDRLAIYDAAGRRLRLLHEGTLSAGTHAMTWDARDGSGRRVGPGVYFVLLERNPLPGIVGRVVIVE